MKHRSKNTDTQKIDQQYSFQFNPKFDQQNSVNRSNHRLYKLYHSNVSKIFHTYDD